MFTIFLFVILAMPAAAFAHADIGARIAAIDARIAQQPAARELYIKRGELHRQHRDWPSALADYRRAHGLSVEADASDIDFYTGRMWWQAGALERALFDLNNFIDRHPANVDARLHRSRVYADLGQTAAAVDDMSVAIRHLQPPSPDFYLERAQLLIRKDMQQYELALRGLDEGIAKLGPIMSLVQLAIQIEIDGEFYPEALLRIDSLPVTVRNNPGWLVRKADVLKATGDDAAARLEYRRALAAIERLPAARRSTQLMLKLEHDLHGMLRAGTTAAER